MSHSILETLRNGWHIEVCRDVICLCVLPTVAVCGVVSLTGLLLDALT